MRRTRKIYELTCPECGWQAYRETFKGYKICSKCGHKGHPHVRKRRLEVEGNPYIHQEIQCAKKYAAGLLNGESLEERMRRRDACMPKVEGVKADRMISMVEGISGVFRMIMVARHSRDEETY